MKYIDEIMSIELVAGTRYAEQQMKHLNGELTSPCSILTKERMAV